MTSNTSLTKKKQISRLRCMPAWLPVANSYDPLLLMGCYDATWLSDLLLLAARREAASVVAELEGDLRRGQQYLSYLYCANLYYFLMTKHRYH
jgi:hypothetical protein